MSDERRCHAGSSRTDLATTRSKSRSWCCIDDFRAVLEHAGTNYASHVQNVDGWDDQGESQNWNQIRKTMPGLSRVITLVDGELTRYYSLQNVGFNFEWYVFISKTYKEVQSTLDEEEEQNAPVIQVKKKAKKVCSWGNVSTAIHIPRLTTCSLHF